MEPELLIVEDDGLLSEAVADYFMCKGWDVTCARDGLEALELLKIRSFRLVLLDVMMPGMDGFSVLRKIREISKIPALMMTARTEDYDKILGLELGADDYITKPYNPLEVMARIKAQLRRCYDYQEEKKGEGEILKAFGLELNLRECSLKKQGREIALTKTEFKILELLMKSPGRIYTKQQIFEYSWEEPFMGDEGTVMVHISNLRNKIEDEPKKPEMIRTVKGLGYRFEKEQL